MTYLLMYLIGSLVAYILAVEIKDYHQEDDSFSGVDDIVIITLFSWIGVIIVVYTYIKRNL